MRQIFGAIAHATNFRSVGNESGSIMCIDGKIRTNDTKNHIHSQANGHENDTNLFACALGPTNMVPSILWSTFEGDQSRVWISLRKSENSQ